MESVRVDKWLWAARCFKTRSQATEACVAGQVQVNGKRAKASQKVKADDRVEAETPGGKRVLVVVALAEKRGPARVAETLYTDHSPPPPPRRSLAEELDAGFTVDRGQGRPRKRDRRAMKKIRGW